MKTRTLLSTAALSLMAYTSTSTSAGAATLIHHYDFSAGVTDSAGTDNGALMDNANTSGGVLNLDGDGDFVQFSAYLVPTGGSYSVSFFATRIAPQNAYYTEVISQAYSGGPGFYIGSAGESMRVTDVWGPGLNFAPSSQMAHYALTVDASNNVSRMYIDGVLAASTNFAISTATGGSTTRLGRQFYPYDEFFHGTIDDLRIYSGALSGDEVARLASPVPEPQGYALFAVGLGLLGTTLLRRRLRPQGARR